MERIRRVWQELNKCFSTNSGTFICGAIWGMLLFILLYGTKILNVTYDDWLLAGGDLSQHYIGWMSYRNSAWTFPLGMMDGLSYPNYTSVIYTDSIPHFALLFKLLSPILPETFQYFGIFGLFSYAMMGGFSCLLLKHFINNLSISLILSTLFIYSPYVLQRMYGHTSLASQWIIVGCLYLWLCRPFEHHVSKKAIAWALMGFAAGGIHMYFLPMVAILCGCSCIDDLLRKTKLKEVGIVLVSMLLGCICPPIIYGAFAGNVRKDSVGLGYYNSNLNTLFDPQGNSLLLKDLAHSEGQYEGYGYLGLGIIILVLVNIFIGVCLYRSKAEVWDKGARVSIVIALAVFIICAVFPTVTLGNRTLLNITLPEKITEWLGIFRAQGRFIWCVCYLVFLVSIVNIFKALDPARFSLRGIAICIAAIQIIDLSPTLASIHYTDRYQDYIEYTYGDMDTYSLEVLFQAGKTAIVYQPSSLYAHDSVGVATAAFAMKNNVKISTFYFARTVRGISEFDSTIKEELSNGIVREDCIYVFSDTTLNLLNYNLCYYKWNNYTIGLSEEHPELETNCGLQRVDFSDGMSIPLSAYSCDSLGEDDDTSNRRSINAGSCLDGPYLPLNAGKYQVTITGENLNAMSPKFVAYDYSEEAFATEEIFRDNETAVFAITIPADVNRLETVLYSDGTSNFYVTGVQIAVAD